MSFARLLLSRNCNVVFADIALRPEAQQTVDEHSGKDGSKARAVFVKCDVTIWDNLEKMFQVADEEFGGADLVPSTVPPDQMNRKLSRRAGLPWSRDLRTRMDELLVPARLLSLQRPGPRHRNRRPRPLRHPRHQHYAPNPNDAARHLALAEPALRQQSGQSQPGKPQASRPHQQHRRPSPRLPLPDVHRQQACNQWLYPLDGAAG